MSRTADTGRGPFADVDVPFLLAARCSLKAGYPVTSFVRIQ